MKILSVSAEAVSLILGAVGVFWAMSVMTRLLVWAFGRRRRP